MDDAAWGALTLALTVLGGIYTWFAYRSRGLVAGLRGAGFTIVPVALLLTDTLELVTDIGGAIGDWVGNFAFSPRGLARDHPGRVSVALLRRRRLPRRAAGSGAAPKRRRSPRARSSTKGKGTKKRAGARPTSTPRWPRSRRCCASAASHDHPRSRQPVERNRLWARLNDAVAAHPEPLATPLMVVDLDAFDANADDLVRRAGGTPIRVASKSVRVPALLSRVLARDGFHGVLGYTLAEALWLEEQGISDDIVVAYPTVDRGALARLVASPAAAGRITLMVDDVAHLDVVDSVRASQAVQVRVAIDVDAGLRMGRQHVGPKRSPLYDADDVVAPGQGDRRAGAASGWSAR